MMKAVEPSQTSLEPNQQAELATAWRGVIEAAAGINRALEIARSTSGFIEGSLTATSLFQDRLIEENVTPIATAVKSRNKVIRPAAFNIRSRPITHVRIPFEELQEQFERHLIELAFKEVGGFHIRAAAACLGLTESALGWLLKHRHENLLKQLRAMS